MTRVFEHSDYKAFLKRLIADHAGQRGYISRLSEMAGCQRAYLSQVVHAQAHLTPEHACSLAYHLGLDETESEYFSELVNLGRAGSPRLQERLRKKLARLKAQADNLAKRTRAPALSSMEVQSRYYSAWHFGAIHMLTSVRARQTPEAIAKRLNLPLPLVSETLRALLAMGLVRQEKGRWSYIGGDLHIPKDSPLNGVNHQHWRTRAVADSQSPSVDGVHYSSVFTIDVKDFELLKSQILKLIDEQRKKIAASGAEELYCFTCDLFAP